ncbi:MAG: hypothetical protein NVSMB5_05860 [Candidatus Velthaea sp.]
MRLISLRIAGFARLTDREFNFTPGLNVVYGPNESGKSTLANAIVATLYGAERRKDAWRPWNGAPFATTLVYELASGEAIEVQREFERDAKGLRVYDRSGNDVAAKFGAGKKLVPGDAHLGIPLDVFINAACVKQQSIAIDEGRDAEPIAMHLARALSGGPKEDAALGAMRRLDEALRTYVGTERARKNAPLRTLREEAAALEIQIAQTRAELDALDDLRARIEHAALERRRLAADALEIDRRARSLRAGTIAKRLAALREFREELAEMQASRAAFDDVAGFPAEREGDLNDAYYAWDFAERTARAAEADEHDARLTETEQRELAARRADAGTIDDATHAALTGAAAAADAARVRASAAAADAAAARRAGTGGAGFLGGILAGGAAAMCVAIGFAIAHSWMWAIAALAVGIALLSVAFTQGRIRGERRRSAERKQHQADEALAAERTAASTVAAVLDPLGLPSVEELTRRRERLHELEARAAAARRSVERANAARANAASAGAHFDRIAALMVPEVTDDREGVRAAVRARSARARERVGLDAHVNALELRKTTILGSDDEYVLEGELDHLVRDGVEPFAEDGGSSLRLIEAERDEIANQLRAAGETLSHLQGELARAESHVADLAGMDERAVRIETEVARLEAFERAVTLAKTTIDTRTQEAHRGFARRLEDYAAQTLAAITAGRYAEIFVDPATLTIRVRVPETQAIVDLEQLSAGTRDQAYLVVRFAMARMFAEGIEVPPLLLDDPFAYWDGTRIERCLPIIVRGAHDNQAILFTSSAELAQAAVAQGAHRIDLGMTQGDRRLTPSPA